MQLISTLPLFTALASLVLLPAATLAHPASDALPNLQRRVDVPNFPKNNATGNIEPLLPTLIEPNGKGSWADAISDFNHKWVRPKFNATEHDPAVTIVTCMDGRIMPEAQYGIPVGKANVLRSAGGRPQDVLGSILVSQHALGSSEIAVFHHTDCGMRTSADKLRTAISDSLSKSGRKKLGAVAKDILATVPLRTFSDLKESLVEDVEWLKKQELISTPKITGWIHNVTDGTVTRVA